MTLTQFLRQLRRESGGFIGQLKHGTGPLTNEQDYALSHHVQGAEVRKYRDVQGEDPNHLPAKFKLAEVRLKAGPIRPKKMTSVFGKIYSTLETNPGVTGRDLVELLKGLDFPANKSAYTQTGKVCAAWLCGYIEGGYFRADRLHFQRFEADERWPIVRAWTSSGHLHTAVLVADRKMFVRYLFSCGTPGILPGMDDAELISDIDRKELERHVAMTLRRSRALPDQAFPIEAARRLAGEVVDGMIARQFWGSRRVKPALTIDQPYRLIRSFFALALRI